MNISNEDFQELRAQVDDAQAAHDSKRFWLLKHEEKFKDLQAQIDDLKNQLKSDHVKLKNFMTNLARDLVKKFDESK